MLPISCNFVTNCIEIPLVCAAIESSSPERTFAKKLIMRFHSTEFSMIKRWFKATAALGYQSKCFFLDLGLEATGV